jgi:hypothetical protein
VSPWIEKLLDPIEMTRLKLLPSTKGEHHRALKLETSMRFASARYAAVLMVSLAACGGGKGSTHDASANLDGGSDMTSAAATACFAQANALCTLRSTCSPNYGIEKNYGSSSVCVTRTADNCVSSLAASGTGNTPAFVDACAAAYPSETCVDYYDGNPVAACEPKAGTLANGAACSFAAQCTSSYCAIPEYQSCGTCATLPVAGASCQVAADCGRDFACAIPTLASDDGGLASSGLCQPFVALNGSCLTGYHPCQNGLTCVGEDETTMTTGTCQTQGATLSAACDSTRKTMANCDANLGLACIPTAKGSGIGTCQAITLVAAGATCGNLGMAPITSVADCMNGGLCKKPDGASTGTCVAAAADGAACDNDSSIGPPCLSPAKCAVPSGSSGTAGTCTLPNAVACM